MADNKIGTKTDKKTQAGRDVYKTPEGEMVSEKSTTFEYKNKWINVPTIHGGKEYSEDQLLEMLDKGFIKPTSIHTKLEDAIKAAQSRSDSLKFNKGGIPMQKQMELFEDGGLKDEGGMVDEESGNEVPVGGTRKGVRDDIPANISEGEFIFPEDVTRYIGLDKLMQLRQDAKMGLKRMEAMGQMGNSDEATMEDDLPFGMADLIIVGGMPEDEEELNMAEGGLTTTATGSTRTVAQPTVEEPTTPVTTQPTATRRLTPEPVATSSIPIDFKQLMGDAAIEYKEYRNAAGESVMIPFVGGVAQFPVPDGYTLYSGTDAVANTNTTAGAIVRAANTATAEVRAASMGGDNDTAPPMPTAEAINWSGLSTKELIERSAELTGTGSTIAKGAMAFLGPFGAIGYAMMRHQEKKVAAEIATRLAKGGLTAAQRKSLTETQEKLAPAKVTTLFGKVIEFVGGALGLTGDDVEAAKKNTANVEAAVAKSTRPVDSSQTAQAFTGSTYDEIPFKSDAKVIADATAMLPELGEIGPTQSVSTANMALDLAEEGRAYDQSVEGATSLYRNMLLGKPLPSGFTEEDITNTIIKRVGVDALREIQSSIRPDMVNPYDPVPNDPLRNVNRELYTLPGDRERIESLKLSEPGSQMTTEQQIEERKRLASAYQQPQVLADPRTTPTTTAASGFAGDQPPIAPISAAPTTTAASGFAGDQPPIASIGAAPTTTAASGFAGDQPPIAPIGTAPTMSSEPVYDMFGNLQTNKGMRKLLDEQLMDRSINANNLVEFQKSLNLGPFGPEREPLSDIDPNTQLESVTPFAPKLSAVPQPVPPSPVTNLDLRPTSVGAQTPQAFGFAGDQPPIASTATKASGFAGDQPPIASTATAASGFAGDQPPIASTGIDASKVSTASDLYRANQAATTADPRNLGGAEGYGAQTFNQAFAANRRAGAKEFSYDRDGDGKLERYTTQTAEEAAPKKGNTLFQSAANLLTPFDNKEYVGGELVSSKKTTSSSGRTTAEIQADINKETKNGKVWTSRANSLVKEREASRSKSSDKNIVTASSGKKVTVQTKPSSNKTEGAVSAGGQYAGDGFEWKKADNGNYLTRTYTGVNENATGSNDTSSASSSSDSKIVCTAMNTSYGFGSYRQAIWLSYSEKNLTKAHEVGYHTLFKPLVKLGYKKNNKIVRAILENIARNRTADLRAEMQGKKRNTLGRIYRAILEPTCYIVGKYKMFKDK